MPYIILELEKPGTTLNHLLNNPNLNRELFLLIDNLISNFYDANVALNFFQDGIIENTNRTKVEYFDEKVKLDRIATDLFIQKHGPESVFEKTYELQKHIKYFIWDNGFFPSHFYSSKVFFNAKIFLFSIDNISKIFGVLCEAKYSCPFNINDIVKKLGKIYPDLRNIRNAAHHQEDVVRGYGKTRKGLKKFTIKPTHTEIGIAPFQTDGMIINGRKYGMTMGDGRLGQIDISTDTLVLIRDLIQEVLNSFSWDGQKQHYPNE